MLNPFSDLEFPLQDEIRWGVENRIKGWPVISLRSEELVWWIPCEGAW